MTGITRWKLILAVSLDEDECHWLSPYYADSNSWWELGANAKVWEQKEKPLLLIMSLERPLLMKFSIMSSFFFLTF